MNVAVIGGGYAGMAAAVTLAERGVPVTVFESARTLGGRARRIEHRELALDNGLHILIGAYRETLRLMRLAGADPERLFLRLPLAWRIHERFHLAAANFPAPLNLLAGLLTARGAALGGRLAAARFMLRMRRKGYRLEQDTSAAGLLEQHAQDARLTRFLWRPLCVSALNTPLEAASAQVFLNVLRDSFDAGRDATDFLLPRADLSALFPEPAAAYISARGGTVLAGQRVTGIDQARDGFTVSCGSTEQVYDCVVCAVAPYHAKAFLIGITALAEVAEAVDALGYQPIYSVYLRYPQQVRLPAPMLGFDSALLQWAFDRGELCGQRGVIGLVISAEGAHQDLPHDELAQLAHQELQQQIGLLPCPLWHRVIAEKRATFSCVPALKRPETRTPLRHFFLAGDYTASEYPATLEAAVRSGVAAAQAILGTP
ncbi:MAG: FAD-dependent oxidoreductase [Betaproteobacteria bacterium]|nr:FAD-dependent oxidoreductase [Betaproteobacteria bacterium]